MPLAFLASLCETDSPGTGEVARSARRGAVAPQGPQPLRRQPPRRGGQEGYPANNRKKQENNIHGQTQ